MAIDKDAIREHVRGILAALGDDPDREGFERNTRPCSPYVRGSFLRE